MINASWMSRGGKGACLSRSPTLFGLLSSAAVSAAFEVKSWDSPQTSGKPRASSGAFARGPLGSKCQHQDWKSSPVGHSTLTRVAAPSTFRWLCIWSREAVHLDAMDQLLLCKSTIYVARLERPSRALGTVGISQAGNLKYCVERGK